MSKITLHSNYTTAYTNVPNTFIDQYMGSANGEFVKVYLYLLRHMDSPEQDFSISRIADYFNYTENDITRALKYWEKANLLRLEYDDAQHLTGICFLDYETPGAAALSGTDGTFPPDTRAGADFRNLEAVPHSGTQYPGTRAGADFQDMTAIPEKPDYSDAEIAGFRGSSEIRQLLYIAETYLGRTLSPTDCQTIFYLYDKLQFPADLIEYLIEYCVVKGHTSIRYIEKTGLAWHEQGIRTAMEAKEQNKLRAKSHTAVMKAFGIKGRSLAKPEQDFVQKWTSSYGFSEDMISEACSRTILAIHQPSFEYADKILQNWQRSHVKQLTDLAPLDNLHKQQGVSRVKTALNAAPCNKFNNFAQRTYNYEQLEKKLVHQ